jgi:hypothetical protein
LAAFFTVFFAAFLAGFLVAFFAVFLAAFFVAMCISFNINVEVAKMKPAARRYRQSGYSSAHADALSPRHPQKCV